MKQINHKIPGFLPPPPKTENDGKLGDLSTKTIQELLELKNRQSKLLNNTLFLSKLADKGAKVQALHDKILLELKAKQDEEQTCILFNKLNLDKESVQNIEWKGKIDDKKNIYLDSDDDSEPEDVLQILSQNNNLQKLVTILEPEKPLITTEDLIKIDEIPHVKYIIEKTEKNNNVALQGHFKPYKTTKCDTHNPEKEALRKKPFKWEVTAATPPSLINGPAKVLNLEESLNLQREHSLHVKEIEAKHAAEKLLTRTGIKIGNLPSDISRFGNYREAASEDSENSDLEGSDIEVHDEEPEKGGVFFDVLK